MEYYPAQLVPLGAVIILPLEYSGLKIKCVLQSKDQVILTTENDKEILYKFDQTVYCKILN